jgi:plastocyanin
MAKFDVDILPPMSFKPKELSIGLGDTVEWVSKDNNDVHTVTHDDGVTFSSPVLNGGDKFTFIFMAAGTFPYHCEIHGAAMMSGKIVVQAASVKHVVEIQAPMAFVPANLDIKVGDTVEWVSKDNSDVHTVTHDDGVTFSSPVLNGGEKFSFAFTAAGTFPYHCEIHGPGIVGKITVK